MSDNPLLNLITGNANGQRPQHQHQQQGGQPQNGGPLSPTSTSTANPGFNRMQGLFNLSNPSLPPNPAMASNQQQRAFSSYGLPLMPAATSGPTAGGGPRAPQPGSVNALQGLVATAAQGRTQNPALLGLLGGFNVPPAVAAPPAATPVDAFPDGADGDASFSHTALTNGRGNNHASPSPAPRPKSPPRRANSKSPTRSAYGGGGHASPTSTSAATIGQRTSRSSSISSNATNNTVVSASVNTMPPPAVPTPAPAPAPAAHITSPTASSFSYTNPFLAFEHLSTGGGPGSQSVNEPRATGSPASASVSIKSDPGARAPAAPASSSSRASTPATVTQGKGGPKKQAAAAAGTQGKSPTTRGWRGGAAPLSPRHAKQSHQHQKSPVIDPSALLDSDTPQELATLRPLSPARLPGGRGAGGSAASSTAATPTSPAAAVPAPADVTDVQLAQLAQSAHAWPEASSDAVFLLRAPPAAAAAGSTPQLVSYNVARAGGGLHMYPMLAKAPADLVPVDVGGDARPAHAGLLTQSADGMYVAYVTSAGEVVVVDVAARQPLSVLDDAEDRRVVVAVDMMPKLIAVAYEGGKVVVFKIKRKEGSVVRFGEVQVVLGGEEAEADVHVSKVLLLPTMQLIALVESRVDGFAQYLVKVDVAGMASAGGDAHVARVVVDLANAPSVTDESGSGAAKMAVKLDTTLDEPVAHLVLSTMSPFYVTCTRSGADLKLWQNLTPARNIVLASALATAVAGDQEIEVVGVHSVAHTDSELVLALATPAAVAMVSVSRAKNKAQMSASILSVITVAGNNKWTRLSGCTSAANQHKLWLQCDTSAGISSGGLVGYTAHARGTGPVVIITLAPGTWLPTKLARVPLPEYPSADPVIGWSVKGNSLVVASEVAGLWAGSVDAAVVLLGGNAGKAETVVPDVRPAVVVQVVSGNKAGGIKTTGSVASISSGQRQASPVQQEKEKEKPVVKKGQVTAGVGKTVASKTETSSAASSPAVVLQRGGSGSGSGRTRAANVRASPVASPTTPVHVASIPAAAAAMAAASPVAPVGLTESQLNALLDARLAQFTARLDADHAARLAAESDRQAQLVRALTESLTSTIHSAVAVQVQSVVVPAVTQQVAEQLAAMSKDHVKQVKHVQQDVVRACQQVVVEKLVPAYESATQEMFKQVAGAFEQGVERMVEQVVEKVGAQLKQVGSVQNGVATSSEGEGEEEESQEEVSEDGEEEEDEESESEEDDEFANAVESPTADHHHQRLTSSSPSPTGAAEIHLQPASAFASFDDYLDHLVSNGAWDQAFRESMSAPDSLPTTWNLIASHPSPPSNDLADFISQPVMIGVLVTLAHQLSVLVADETLLDARVRWMQALINSLDIEDPTVSPYVGQYLAQAVAEVASVEKVLVQNMRAGKRSAYLPAVGLLLRTLKSTVEMVVKG